MFQKEHLNSLLNSKFLGGAKVAFEETGFYLTEDNKTLKILIVSSTRVPEGRIINQIQPLPVDEKPVDLVFQDAPTSYLISILDRIISGKLPTPEQKRNQEILAQEPNSPQTQAVIETCLNSNCICPLMFSPLGCLSLINTPIKPTLNYCRVYTPPEMLTHRKVISNLLSHLANKVPKEQFLNYLRQLTQGEIEEIQAY